MKPRDPKTTSCRSKRLCTRLAPPTNLVVMDRPVEAFNASAIVMNVFSGSCITLTAWTAVLAGSTPGTARSGVIVAAFDFLNLGWNLKELAPDFLMATFCLVATPLNELEQAVSYSLDPLRMAAPARGKPGMVYSPAIRLKRTSRLEGTRPRSNTLVIVMGYLPAASHLSTAASSGQMIVPAGSVPLCSDMKRPRHLLTLGGPAGGAAPARTAPSANTIRYCTRRISYRCPGPDGGDRVGVPRHF